MSQQNIEPMLVTNLIQNLMAVEVGRSPDAGLGESLLWYRGQADAAWELQPGVLRCPHQQNVGQQAFVSSDPWRAVLGNERILNQRFAMEASPFLGDVEKTRVYFVAQHHGLPTRLLDWSLNPLVALFFACSDQREHDGCIYQLFPKDLPGILHGLLDNPPSPFNNIVHGDHPAVREFIRDCLFDALPLESLQTTPVIPLIPIASTPRIIAQSSRFTFHPPIVEQESGIMQSPYQLHAGGNLLRRYIIPSGHKAQILAELNRLGVHYYSLFPDLDHLALHLKNIYCERMMCMTNQP